MPGSSKPGFFLFIFKKIGLNTSMSLHDKILDAIDSVKYKVDDLVFTAKNKVYDLVDYVRYEVLNKDLPEFNLDLDEEKPKKTKKKKTKKKKK